jgi:hypothetical protein
MKKTSIAFGSGSAARDQGCYATSHGPGGTSASEAPLEIRLSFDSEMRLIGTRRFPSPLNGMVTIPTITPLHHRFRHPASGTAWTSVNYVQPGFADKHSNCFLTLLTPFRFVSQDR